MKKFASTPLDPWHPWPLFMLETATAALFVMVLLVGMSLLQERPPVVAGMSPPAVTPVTRSTPPTITHPTAALTQPALPAINEPAVALTQPPLGHEERLIALLERLSARLETTTAAQPSREFINALDRLGQQMVQATQSMAAAQTRELQEQALNRDLLLGLNDHLEKMQELLTGPTPLPVPVPKTSIPLQPLDAVTSSENPNAKLVPSSAALLSQLRTMFSHAPFKIFVNTKTATITLPTKLNFDQGSPKPNTKQKRALSAIARGLAQILPCYVARSSTTLPCPDNNPDAPRISAIRIRGRAAFAHSDESRFYFNAKLATSRAFHALKTLLTIRPDLLSLKNSRGQTLFQIEGLVGSSNEDRNKHQLDLRFFFEPTDNTAGESTPLPPGVP